MKDVQRDASLLKRAFFYTLIFSLAAHAYMYFSLALSHDSLHSAIIGDREIAGQISLGRFMQPVYWLVRGRMAVPWLIGALSILFLTGSSFLILQVLGIENRVSVALLCGIFSTNLTVTAANATYMPWADVYALALLLACCGVYLWERCAGWGCVAAMPLFALSMGLYQAYIDVAIGLALILLIRYIAEGEPFSRLWRRAVRYAVSLLGGAAMYFVLMKLTMRLSGTEMADTYNGLTNLLDSDIVSLLRLVPSAYFDFAAVLLSPLRSYNTVSVCVCTGLSWGIGALLWARCLRRRHIRGAALALGALCVALLPLGLNFVYVLAAGQTHLLMTFSFFLVYAVVLLPLEARETLPSAALPHPISICRTALFLLCGAMIFQNVVYANGAYFEKRLIFESTSQYAYSIVETMERDPAYEPGVTPVAVIGEFPRSYMDRDDGEEFSRYRHLTGMWDGTSITYLTSFGSYCDHVLGHPVDLITDASTLTEIAVRRATREMPVFPKEGYCQMADGVMIVKLEDLF